MLKEFLKNKKIIIILLVIIIILTCSNIYSITKYKQQKDNSSINNSLNESNYNKENIYYTELDYSSFNKMYNNNEYIILAVVDNSSNTYLKFKQLINKLSYYKKININLLETSKLSKKNEISFYEIDKRFTELQTNYIAFIKEKKVVAITTFDNNNLNTIIEQIEKGNG